MQLIKDLGPSYPTEKSKYKVRFGLYVCPSCLKHFKVRTANVLNGSSMRCRSCATTISRPSVKHGLSHTPLYRVWAEMKSRCYYKGKHNYKWYGGRGVTVCKEWLDSPEIFIKWAEANGWRSELQIDKDELSTKLGINPPIYSPETCQFVTPEKNLALRNGTYKASDTEDKKSL